MYFDLHNLALNECLHYSIDVSLITLSEKLRLTEYFHLKGNYIAGPRENSKKLKHSEWQVPFG